MMKKVLVLLFLVISFASINFVQAAIITQIEPWDVTGVNVYINYPDKVTYGDYFDISFTVNGGEIDPSLGMIAFIPYVWVSDTVDISEVAWGEDYISDDPDFHGNYSGSLGDEYTPYISGRDEYKLIDPFFFNYASSEYTWLDKDYNDIVTWSLYDFIIQGDTTFSITLDGSYWGGQFGYGNFTVLVPPAISLAIPIPEPGSFFLMALSLLFLGIRGHKRFNINYQFFRGFRFARN